MGNFSDKCSCLSSHDFLANMELEGLRIYKKAKIITDDTEGGEAIIVKSKNNGMVLNADNIKVGLELDNKTTEKVKKLQFCIRGVLFRMKFINIKKKLANQSNKLKEQYLNDCKSHLQYKAESRLGPFNKQGWTKYYSEESSYLFNYDPKYFGILLNTPIHVYDKTSYYVGTVNIRNQRCGFGMLFNNEGEKYEGNWVNNKFTGWGRYIDIEGTILEGHFINNNLNGKGEKHLLNGNSYFGDFKNNHRHGRGQEETIEHFYEGEFKYDKKDGIGKLSYKLINDNYEGEFKDNAIIGTGIYKWTNGDSFEGTFLHGKMHGRGVYRWPDGGEYEGEYYNNLKEGFGVFKWSNGKVYKGSFHNGRPHGNGLMYSENDTFDVEFEDGKLIQSVKIEKMFTNKTNNSENNIKYLQRVSNALKKQPSPTESNISSITNKKSSPFDSKDISLRK